MPSEVIPEAAESVRWESIHIFIFKALVLLLIPIIIFELEFCSFQFLHVVAGSLHVYSVYQFDILSIGTHVELACNGVLCREITFKRD